jgi:glycosyltransferase involved in cell wall biosynthesis
MGRVFDTGQLSERLGGSDQRSVARAYVSRCGVEPGADWKPSPLAERPRVPKMMSETRKVLQVAAVDTTVRYLLLPLIDALETAGYEVHVVCSAGPHTQSLATQGYRMHSLPIARRIAPLSNLRTVWLLYLLMRRERFAVVHVHTPVAAALGRIAAWFAHTPVVVSTAHGFYFHDLMPRWAQRAHTRIERLLCRWCTDALFTQSAEDRDTAVREGLLPADRVFCIGNGVDVGQFSVPSRQDVRSAFGFLPSDPVVLFVGRLVREKGVEELLRAMAEVVVEVPDAKLLIVGGTLASERDQKTARRVEQIVARRDLATLVIFAGPRDDIPEILSAVDLFVLPSRREGMPRTILEAMAAGKPVVATDIRGCREEVIHEVTGLLVPVADPHALAQSISRLLANKEEAAQMGEAGRRRAESGFDEKRVLDRQVSVYAQLVNQRWEREGHE